MRLMGGLPAHGARLTTLLFRFAFYCWLLDFSSCCGISGQSLGLLFSLGVVWAITRDYWGTSLGEFRSETRW